MIERGDLGDRLYHFRARYAQDWLRRSIDTSIRPLRLSSVPFFAKPKSAFSRSGFLRLAQIQAAFGAENASKARTGQIIRPAAI